MASLQSVLEQALQLDERERGKLIELLVQSLDPEPGEEITGDEWDKAWGTEIERRLQEIRDGKVELVDADEVLEELTEMSKRP